MRARNLRQLFTLGRRITANCAAAIRSAYVFEAQEVERLRLSAVFRRRSAAKRPKSSSRVFSSASVQVEPRKPLPQLPVEAFRIPLVLETHHKIIGEPTSDTPRPGTIGLNLLLEPEVEHIVQVDVGQERAERTALRRSLLGSDDDPVLHDARH